MKTHLLSCALLFVVTFCYSQFSENFENGIPGSMTQEYLIGVNDWFNCLWGVTNGGIDRSGGFALSMGIIVHLFTILNLGAPLRYEPPVGFICRAVPIGIYPCSKRIWANKPKYADG